MLGSALYQRVITGISPLSRRSSHFLRSNTRRRPALCTVGKGQDVPHDLDAILVLGGGLTPDGRLPEWVKRRVELGKRLYDLQDSHKCWLLCLGAGTPHKPVVIKKQHAYHEATACAKYLLSQGVPAERILKETSSYDTVGNGYFAATIHAVPAEWRKCAIVTSAFHMLRTEAIFRTCFGLAGKSLRGNENFIDLHFYAASDNGIFHDGVLLARQSKEKKSYQDWIASTAQIQTLQDLHAWLYSTHLCYAVSRQDEFGSPKLDDNAQDVLASY